MSHPALHPTLHHLNLADHDKAKELHKIYFDHCDGMSTKTLKDAKHAHCFSAEGGIDTAAHELHTHLESLPNFSTSHLKQHVLTAVQARKERLPATRHGRREAHYKDWKLSELHRHLFTHYYNLDKAGLSKVVQGLENETAKSGSVEVDGIHSHVPAYLLRTYDQRFGPEGRELGDNAIAHFCQDSYDEMIKTVRPHKAPGFRLPATAGRIQPFVPPTARATLQPPQDAGPPPPTEVGPVGHAPKSDEMQATAGQQSTEAWYSEIEKFRNTRYGHHKSLRTLQEGYLKGVFKSPLSQLRSDAAKEAPTQPADDPFFYVNDVAHITRKFLIEQISARGSSATTAHLTPEAVFTTMNTLKKAAHKALFKETFWPAFVRYSEENCNDAKLERHIEDGIDSFVRWLQKRNIYPGDIDLATVACASGPHKLRTEADWFHAYWLHDQLEPGKQLRRGKIYLWAWALKCMDEWETRFFNCNSTNFETLKDEMVARPSSSSSRVS